MSKKTKPTSAKAPAAADPFNAKLKELRTAKGFSMSKAAMACGMLPTNYYAYEKTKLPKVPVLRRFCKGLDLNPDEVSDLLSLV